MKLLMLAVFFPFFAPVENTEISLEQVAKEMKVNTERK